MALKPVTPTRRKGPVARPVVIVQSKKKSSSSGGWIVALLVLAAAAGGYFVYNNSQQQKAAAQQKLEAAAAQKAEQERKVAEQKRQHEQEIAGRATALGSVAPTAGSAAPAPAPRRAAGSSYGSDTHQTQDESAANNGLGSTTKPTVATGMGEADVSATPPPFDLNATDNKAKTVIRKLDEAIAAAAEGDTFHDLQEDLKSSFEQCKPGLFSDPDTLPAFPAKEEKLLRMAQGVYVCLNLATEVQLSKEISAEKHARFVNWLMKDKAKAARTFTYGLEHYGIDATATATDLMTKLRDAYIKNPSGAMDKIPAITKSGKGK